VGVRRGLETGVSLGRGVRCGWEWSWVLLDLGTRGSAGAVGGAGRGARASRRRKG